MIDPLSEVVALLQPAAGLSKIVSGAGQWRIRRQEAGQPFYCVVLDGNSLLTVDQHGPIPLAAGDFVLIPAAYGFAMSSHEPAGWEQTIDSQPVALANGEFRLGVRSGPPDVRLIVGHCTFGSPDAALLVSLLPALVHVRDEARLATLVQLLRDESHAQRPARDVVMTRLLEVLLIEAFRATPATSAPSGLLRGLNDSRLAVAIRRMHEDPTQAWTVARLAKEAALSRSAFFERFSRAVGVAPMAYLLAWRMALAKNLLRRNKGSIAEVAQRVGYSSASTFSVAFSRFVGMPPTQFARTRSEP